jgi:ferredoxin/flavodoxin
MKNITFYFSGTGNSLKVAKELALTLPDTELYSMGNANAPHIGKEIESIGFIFPLYFWGLPAAVQHFVNALRPDELHGKYIYAICTSGSGKAFNSMNGLTRILKQKNAPPLNYGGTLKMFSNYVFMYDMRSDVKGITAKSNDAMKPIIADIAARRENEIKKPFFLTRIIATIVNRSFHKSVAKKDEGFYVSDTCTGCGTCQKVCPVGNIKMENNRPKYTHHCESCTACIHYCPVRAIQWKDKTQKRGRYHHPDINAEEIARMNRHEI